MSSKGKSKLAKPEDLEPTFEKTYTSIRDILLNARNRALRAIPKWSEPTGKLGMKSLKKNSVVKLGPNRV